MTTPELKAEIKVKLEEEQQSFSSAMIRLFVGIVAFALPIMVSIIVAFAPLTSISASYYTLARDMFVGLLFALGLCLFAYRGNDRKENLFTTIGGLAAWTAALSPTACDGCPIASPSILHMVGGLTLFFITGYICLGQLYKKASVKNWDKAQLRAKWYKRLGWGIFFCWGILIILGILGAFKIITSAPTTVFWGELLMLWMFGIAWAIAAKWIHYFVDEGKTTSGKVKDTLLDPLKELGIKK
jgi:hypothetical protein